MMFIQSQEDSKSSPRIVTSKRRIAYRESTWKVHKFDIWSVELVCKVVVLKVDGALFIWVGGGGNGALELGELALGVPAANSLSGRGGLGTALLGADGGYTALARRLAAWLRRPVYVSSSCGYDRINVPLIERGLITEIKNRTDLFHL
nr:uncharacterized protein LOC128670595 [Plodia interpunctella]